MAALTAQTRVHEIRDYVLHRHQALERHRILDLGCGDGARALALASRRFNRVTGVEASESLLQIARNRARKKGLDVEFVHADPWATPFESASFDEVLILGGLFGHGKTPRADVELLLEARRLIKPGGVLRLCFPDGAWLKENSPGETVEALSSGFIYRHRTVMDHGHCLKTEMISADEASGIRHSHVMVEWLYSQREVSDLLYRLGFRAMAYEPEPPAGAHDTPVHTVRCIIPPGRLQPVSLAG